MSDTVRRVLIVIGLLLLIAAPYQLDAFWLQSALFAMASAIAAIGLTLLVGITGQLSLGHMFFVAIGAYGYGYFGGEQPEGGLSTLPDGLGLPTPLALLMAVVLAGIAGALFSPIAGRLRGIYLGLASLGLVFLGQHILREATGVTGGFNGRGAEPFSIFGFSFSGESPDDLFIGGVEFGDVERLWYLGLLLVALCWWLGRNLINSRPGRALQAVRDSEIAAGAMGIDVRVYKAAAFTVSSMFAGLGGVFLALAYQQYVPESFGFLQSIDLLVIIVLGGLGSIGGAVLGAVVVGILPRFFEEYASSLPLVAQTGSDGLQPEQASRLLFGAAVVIIIIFAPRGLAGMNLGARLRRKSTIPTTKESTA